MKNRRQPPIGAPNQDHFLLDGSPEAEARKILASSRPAPEKVAALEALWGEVAPSGEAASSPVSATPLLSVCIPTYNRAEYLFALLASLAAEFAARPALRGEVEIVVVDNASADLTGEVVRLAQRTLGPVDYHRNPTNIGPDPNFFKALSLARGEYEWLVGDDDLIAPGGLAAIVDHLRNAAPDHLFISPEYMTVQRETLHPHVLGEVERRDYSLVEVLKRMGYTHVFALISLHVFRRRPFLKNLNGDLARIISYYPLSPILLKTFHAATCHQLYFPVLRHRVNDRFEDSMAINHTRLLGMLRTFRLLMDDGVLKPSDFGDIFELLPEFDGGWHLLDELATNCEDLLDGPYALPIEDLTLIDDFFVRTDPRDVRGIRRLVADARFERHKPIMMKAVISSKSVSLSAAVLVTRHTDLSGFAAALRTEPDLSRHVEVFCIALNRHLSRAEFDVFDQIVVLRDHMLSNSSELVNTAAQYAHSRNFLALTIDDATSAARAAERLLHAYRTRTEAPAPVISLEFEEGLEAPRGPGAARRSLLAAALDGDLEKSLFRILRAARIDRDLFYRFGGCDLSAKVPGLEYALVDFAWRARGDAPARLQCDRVSPVSGVPGAGCRLGASLLSFLEGWRRFPLIESEGIRRKRLRLAGASIPPRRSGPCRRGRFVSLLGAEGWGLCLRLWRELLSAYYFLRKRVRRKQ